MAEDRPKIAVNVFVVRGGKLLLGKRKNSTGDGFWGLPGGKLDKMESLVAGVRRELEEETGLTVRKLSLAHVMNDPCIEDGTHFLHINFLAEDEDVVGEPEVKEPDKCAKWQWFSLDALPDDIFLGHRQSIAAFGNGAKFIDYALGDSTPNYL